MITEFRLENFKSHRDTTVPLKQFTLLVGDNGSGKTSVLEALRLQSQLSARDVPSSHDTYKDWLADAQGFEAKVRELVRHGETTSRLTFHGLAEAEPWNVTLSISETNHAGLKIDYTQTHATATSSGYFELLSPHQSPQESLHHPERLLGRVALYRFRAPQIAEDSYSSEVAASIAEDGSLSAVVLAALKQSDDDAFAKIQRAMRRLIPSLERVFTRPVQLLHPSNPNPVVGSKLYFDFRGAKNIPAHHASQGTLIALALLTVLHGPRRPRLILLDDFDHALHPRAQMELVRLIKELLALEEFHDTQIVATTHSPYVLDEVSPEEIVAFALRDDGTVAAKPLSEHPDAPKVNGSLKAGELWSLDAERDWVQ